MLDVKKRSMRSAVTRGECWTVLTDQITSIAMLHHRIIAHKLAITSTSILLYNPSIEKSFSLFFRIVFSSGASVQNSVPRVKRTSSNTYFLLCRYYRTFSPRWYGSEFGDPSSGRPSGKSISTGCTPLSSYSQCFLSFFRKWFISFNT